jgi:predicted RNA-binding Zn ribbon-like protein
MPELRIEDVKLVGGRLAIDFANTVNRHQPEVEGERLRSYPALVAWGRHAGAISKEVTSRLLAVGQEDPEAAEAALHRAVDLREGLFRLFMATTYGEGPDPEDLSLLNATLSQALSHLRLTPEADALLLDWAEDDPCLERVLWPVVRSAGEVLSSPEDLSRLRHCAGEDCDWIFLDQSRNRSRRWCDMADCGNRAKARRFYAQRRAARGGHK